MNFKPCARCGGNCEGFLCAGILIGVLSFAALPARESCFELVRKPPLVNFYCDRPPVDLPHVPHDEPLPWSPLRLSAAVQTSVSTSSLGTGNL
jgi:hypothetical protein